MRISDWSSDVCSSDLRSYKSTRHNRQSPETTRPPGGGRVALPGGKSVANGRGVLALGLGDHRLDRAGDRKSVVEGKSVLVRVDLGGRRTLKKKTDTDQHSLAQTHTITAHTITH